MQFIKQYRLSILTAFIIWVVCMIPVPETPLSSVSFIDKWTHFVMYGTLIIIMLWEHKRVAWLPIALAICQGILIEFAQAYLTTCRSGDWFDAVCNTLGVIFGAVIVCSYKFIVHSS